MTKSSSSESESGSESSSGEDSDSDSERARKVLLLQEQVRNIHLFSFHAVGLSKLQVLGLSILKSLTEIIL